MFKFLYAYYITKDVVYVIPADHLSLPSPGLLRWLVRSVLQYQILPTPIVLILLQSSTALNSRILYSLLLGLYTGIVAVTLESICERNRSTTVLKRIEAEGNDADTNKTRPVGRGMVIVISTLHIVTSVNFIADWVYTRNLFVGNAQSSWAEYLFANSDRVTLTLVMGVAVIRMLHVYP
ncbi:hypothetical protein IW262DRAFT_303583 [Armillaria fumosa]|nr:hypothetical protein IW262DRAFT_303583 [Armillaria fumosa]